MELLSKKFIRKLIWVMNEPGGNTNDSLSKRFSFFYFFLAGKSGFQIPSLTISSLENPKTPIRNSMTDTYGMIDEKTFEANSLAISDAILSTVYQSNVSRPGINKLQYEKYFQVDENGLAVSFESVKAWARLLASEPRPAGNITSRLTNDISKVCPSIQKCTSYSIIYFSIWKDSVLKIKLKNVPSVAN